MYAPNARGVGVHESHRIEPRRQQSRHFYSLRIRSRQRTQCTTEFRYHSCKFVVLFIVISILDVVPPHHLNFPSSILRLPRQKVNFLQQLLLMPLQLPHRLLLFHCVETPQTSSSFTHTHTHTHALSFPLSVYTQQQHNSLTPFSPPSLSKSSKRERTELFKIQQEREN